MTKACELKQIQGYSRFLSGVAITLDKAFYTHLLRNLMIDQLNQVWAADITYIPMRRGFVDLGAWWMRPLTRCCPGVSNTLTTDFCVDAVREAICRYGTPEIFNTGQGSQFTNTGYSPRRLPPAIGVGGHRG